jgi:hypothetical protein
MCTPFGQLVERSTNHLKENISKRLHNHSFITVLSALPSNLHQTRLRSCERPDVGVWLLTHLLIPLFCVPTNVFSTTLCTRLGISHPLMLGVSHYICN